MKMSKGLRLSLLTTVAAAATMTAGCDGCDDSNEHANDIRRCVTGDLVVVEDDKCEAREEAAQIPDGGLQDAGAVTTKIPPCEHNGCQPGKALAADCDPIVTVVCESDPSCCEKEWDEFCAEDVQDTCNQPQGADALPMINTTTITERTVYHPHLFFWYYGGYGSSRVGTRVTGGSWFINPSRVYASPFRGGGVVVGRGGAVRGGGFGAVGRGAGVGA